MLLARRLVEAGVRFVTIQGYQDTGIYAWDHHWGIFSHLDKQLPIYDSAYSALLNDLDDRGMLETTLVITAGEFGRTPRISHKASTGKGVASATKGTVQPGRDHWPRATSILFAGGGIPPGELIGATDSRGEDANDRVVGRDDFLATIYHHLGVDADHLALADFAGRPIPVLRNGTPIRELTARG